MTGQRYGRLTVLHLGERKADKTVCWVCKCDCGNILTVRRHDLRSGNTLSCGCYHKDIASETTYRRMHEKGVLPKDETKRLYDVWAHMKQRCNNPKVKGYQYYGGRGIKVCPEWERFRPFWKWAIDNGYDRFAQHGKCTIDRIDVNGDYCPENCRWVSMEIQRKNQRPRRKRVTT